MTIEQLQQRIIEWAQTHDDIRMIVLLGSRARREHAADEYSDLDLILFVNDIEAYRQTGSWLPELGNLWVSVPYDINDKFPEHLVLFEPGIKADFAFFSLDRLDEMMNADDRPRMYERGFRVLLDKDGISAKIPPPSYQKPIYAPPTEAEFRRVVDKFWYEVYNEAREIKRKNLWVVKVKDIAVKSQLLTMLEWYAQTFNHADTWYDGRFMSQWVDAATWDELHYTFGRFNPADSWRALRATVALFRELSQQVGTTLGYEYGFALAEKVTRWVERLQEEV